MRVINSTFCNLKLKTIPVYVVRYAGVGKGTRVFIVTLKPKYF